MELYINLLKEYCDEINKKEYNKQESEKVAEAIEDIIRLAKQMRNEGLLSLLEEAENLDCSDDNMKALKELILMITDGMETRLVRSAGINRGIAFGFRGYKGLIHLIYLEGIIMIQCGDTGIALEYALKSMLPRKYLDEYEMRELIRMDANDLKYTREWIEMVSDEKDLPDDTDESIAGITAKAICGLKEDILKKVISEVDSDILAIALKGLPGAAIKRIFDNLSEDESLRVAEDSICLGPIRMMDVENRCQRILDIIKNNINEFILS